MDAVVGERHEVLLVDRIPDAQLGGDPSVEVAQHVEAVGALRRGREPEQLGRLDVLEQRSVRRRRGVVELVDDHDVEVRRIEGTEPDCVEALDRREDVLESLRAMLADPELAEARIAQRVSERRPALLQDLLPVGHEQQPRAGGSVGRKSRVVDRRHDGLAGAGGGDEQVAVPPVPSSDLDLLEQPLLERTQVDLRRRQLERGRPTVRDRVRSTNSARSYGTKSSLSQYDSKTAAIFDTTSGLRRPETRTFHSSPVTCALWVRFDEPMYAVVAPRCRWNSHAFACSRVVVVS